MKLFVSFLAILGVTNATSFPSGKVLKRSSRDLDDDVADFAALIPLDQVTGIVIEYLAEDEEIQRFMEYVESDDFKDLILAVEAIPEYVALLKYLDAGGLDVYAAINILHSYLGLQELPVPNVLSKISGRITGGIAGLITDIKNVLPLDDLRALYEEKLKTSKEFAALVALLSSEEIQRLVAELKDNEEYQKLREKAISAGLDIEGIVDLLKSLLGLV